MLKQLQLLIKEHRCRSRGIPAKLVPCTSRERSQSAGRASAQKFVQLNVGAFSPGLQYPNSASGAIDYFRRRALGLKHFCWGLSGVTESLLLSWRNASGASGITSVISRTEFLHRSLMNRANIAD